MVRTNPLHAGRGGWTWYTGSAGWMYPAPRRWIPPNSLWEITARTIQGRILLRPSAEVNDLILGVMGRALTLFAVTLHDFIWLSNHALLTASDPETLSRFMCFLNGNIARKVSAIIGWSGAFWSRR